MRKSSLCGGMEQYTEKDSGFVKYMHLQDHQKYSTEKILW